MYFSGIILVKMGKPDKRKYPRVKIHNPISYIGSDKNDNILEQNMGIALDVSQDSILIETLSLIESEFVILNAIDPENNLIEIKGRVVYSRENGTRKFIAGLSFLGTHSEKIQFAKKIIKAFYQQKKKASTDRGFNHLK